MISYLYIELVVIDNVTKKDGKENYLQDSLAMRMIL